MSGINSPRVDWVRDGPLSPGYLYDSVLADKDWIVIDYSIRVNLFHNIISFMRVVKIARLIFYSEFSPVIIISYFSYPHISVFF